MRKRSSKPRPATTTCSPSRARLYPTNANGTPRAIDPADRRSLLMLDPTSNPNHVLGAIGIGDVEHAAHVGSRPVGSAPTPPACPAWSTRPPTCGTRLRHPQAGRRSQPELGGHRRLGGLRAARVDDRPPGPRRRGAPRRPRRISTASGRGWRQPAENPQQEITAFGHSYGSLVTSLALQQGDSHVHDVVFYGSPGLELNNVGDLHLAPGGHAFFEQAAHDPIALIQKAPELGRALLPALAVPPLMPLGVLGLVDVLGGSGVNDQWFGNTPNQVAGIIPLSTAAGADPILGISRAAADVHADYPRAVDGALRMSGYNLAAVLSGVPHATKTGN